MSTAARRTIAARLYRFSAVLAAVVVPVACHKEPTAAPVQQAATNTTLTTNATVANAVAGVPFSFPGGAGAISPSVAGQNLTLTFGGTTTAPSASMVITPAAGGASATITADVTFGSCIFKVTATTGTVPANLAVGQIITVNPCNLNVSTQGATANGVAANRAASLFLGAAASTGTLVTVSVNAGGGLTINGSSVGTVTLVPVSG